MEPTPVVRAVTYERDGERCVACGTSHPLSYQHRQAVGMGGSRRRPKLADGVTACMVCNALFEASMQSKALRYGWKVPRWVEEPAAVPVFVQWEHRWYLLGASGGRSMISREFAETLMVGIYGEAWRGWES